MNENENYVVITASRTHPGGVTIAQTDDGADPLNHDMAVDCDGTLKSMVLSVIPGTEEDGKLQMLFDANLDRPGNRWEEIKATVIYPHKKEEVSLAGGVITSCVALGESRIYRFVFSLCK